MMIPSLYLILQSLLAIIQRLRLMTFGLTKMPYVTGVGDAHQSDKASMKEPIVLGDREHLIHQHRSLLCLSKLSCLNPPKLIDDAMASLQL